MLRRSIKRKLNAVVRHESKPDNVDCPILSFRMVQEARRLGFAAMLFHSGSFLGQN